MFGIADILCSQGLDLCRSWMGTVNQKGYKKLPPAPVALNEIEIENFGLEDMEELDDGDDDDDDIILDTEEADKTAAAIEEEVQTTYKGLRVEDMIKVTAKNKFFDEDGIVRRLKGGKVMIRFFTYGSMYEEWLDPSDVRKLSDEEVINGLGGPAQPITQDDIDGPKRFDRDDFGDSRGQSRRNMAGAFGAGGRNRRQDRTADRFRQGDSLQDQNRERKNWDWYKDNERRNQGGAYADGDFDMRGSSREGDVDSQWGRGPPQRSRDRPQPNRERQPNSGNGGNDWSAFIAPTSSSPSKTESDDFFDSLMTDLSNDLGSEKGSKNFLDSSGGSDEDDFFASLVSEISDDEQASSSPKKRTTQQKGAPGSDGDFFASLENELQGSTSDKPTRAPQSFADEFDDLFSEIASPDSSPASPPSRPEARKPTRAPQAFADDEFDDLFADFGSSEKSKEQPPSRQGVQNELQGATSNEPTRAPQSFADEFDDLFAEIASPDSSPATPPSRPEARKPTRAPQAFADDKFDDLFAGPPSRQEVEKEFQGATSNDPTRAPQSLADEFDDLFAEIASADSSTGSLPSRPETRKSPMAPQSFNKEPPRPRQEARKPTITPQSSPQSPAFDDLDDFFAEIASFDDGKDSSPSNQGARKPTREKEHSFDEDRESSRSRQGTWKPTRGKEPTDSDGPDDNFAGVSSVYDSGKMGATPDADTDDFFADLEAELESELATFVPDSPTDEEEPTTTVETKSSREGQKAFDKNGSTPSPHSHSLNPSDLQKCTVPVLKDMLRDRGMKVSGRKAELIERLIS
eukprot:scaffold22609_cov142-Cylindrotheca_fusiformis.AAC.2